MIRRNCCGWFRTSHGPAIDPLASSSRILDPQVLGQEHYDAAREVQRILQRYRDLQEIIAILGIYELSADGKRID